MICFRAAATFRGVVVFVVQDLPDEICYLEKGGGMVCFIVQDLLDAAGFRVWLFHCVPASLSCC